MAENQVANRAAWVGTMSLDDPARHWIDRVAGYFPVMGAAVAFLLAYTAGMTSANASRWLLIGASVSLLIPWSGKAGWVARFTVVYLVLLPVQWLASQYIMISSGTYQVYVSYSTVALFIILVTSLAASLRALNSPSDGRTSRRFVAAAIAGLVVLVGLLTIVSTLIRYTGQAHSGLTVLQAGPLLLFIVTFTTLATSLRLRSVQCIGIIACIYYLLG
jgi:hypothetical protein